MTAQSMYALFRALKGSGKKASFRSASKSRWSPAGIPTGDRRATPGLPPQHRLVRSSENDEGNLKNATFYYPAPKRYSEQGLDAVGYQGRVLFPIDAELRRVGMALNADMTVNLLAMQHPVRCRKPFTLTLKVPSERRRRGPKPMS